MRYISYCFSTLLLLFFLSSCGSESTPVYSLTTTPTPDDAGSVSPSSGEYDEGESVEISAIPNEDWIFDGWQGDATGSDNPTTVTMDADKDIAATFVLREYPLTIETDGEGTVSEQIVQEKTTDYEAGTTVELTANAADGWEFVEWQGDLNSSSNPNTIIIDGDKNITAVFTNLTFSGGIGSEENPYKVSTVYQLQIVNDYLDSHFIQVDHIDASSFSGLNNGKGFNPIGSPDTPFTGIFDGDGYEISGLVINRIDEDYVGLFGYTDNARIQNTNLINSSVYGKNYVGGMIGYSNLTKINDSNSSAYIYGDDSSVGGLIGENEKGNVSNSFSTGSVSGNLFVGGLIGTNQGLVEESFASGNVTGENYVGGLVGSNSVYANIYNSRSYGDVSGNHFIGGLVGSNSQSEIKRSYATGEVQGDSRIGGFAGYNLITGLITESYATGNVTGINQVGGLVGLSTQSQIIDSYSNGNISGDQNIGGLVGENSSEVKSSYSIGRVEGSENVGGFIGLNESTTEYNYWDIETSKQNNGIGSGNSEGITNLTTSEMQGSSAQDNMPEFDWDEIWMTVSGGYPILRWQEE